MLNLLRVQQQQVLALSYQQVITNFNAQKPIYQLCSNKIHVNNIIVSYCQKQALSSSNQVSQQLISQKYHSYFSLYTEKMKDVIVNFQILPLDLPSFYLFGATENILIQNSKIDVKVSQLLSESALICFKCDLHAIQSTLIFIGFGSNISGLVLIGKSYITLESCSVQSRLSGKMIGGLVMQSNQITMNIKDSNLTSYFNGNGSVGALISFATDDIQIQSSNIKMCTNMVKNVGSGESFVTISDSVTQSCQICENMKYSYGICTSSLDNSEEIDYKLVCKPVFVFDGEACSCQDGKVLNGSSCVTILDKISILLNQFESFDLSIRQIDVKLFDKISVLKQSATNQINQVSSSTPNFNARIDTQSGVNTYVYQRYLALSEAIQQFALKINCGRQYGYAYVNNQCQYAECPISGQYAINGICQCPIQNMLVIGNACVCPVNSSLINNVCTCTVTGQVVKNGACQCEVVDAIVSGNTCVCPASSSVVGNVCVCSVTGKVIIGGVCICPTSGAFILNGACSCGTDGLNISNVCSCPTHSSLVGNACICSGIIGISMISGSCQCPQSHIIANGQCQYTNIDTQITCPQFSYATLFDIQAITHSVINTANFSNGYVFKTSPIITNAFIDIQNNVYTTLYSYTGRMYPLFYTQSSFTNFKIQISTQSFGASGPLVTQYATTVYINQMNIISKLDTQLTVNSLSELQILQNSTTSTNINNLLVNLSFALSSGNITLINASSGVMNITGYQVLGIYYSTQYVAMIAFSILPQSNLRIYNVTFQPSFYNVGNQSSYFIIYINSQFSNVNNISFNNISLNLGDISQFQTLASVSSTASKKYIFGGLITLPDSNTILNITNLLLNCYQNVNTDYVFNSGFILGFKDYVDMNITLQDTCIQQNISSKTLNFENTGLVGGQAGCVYIKQSSIMLTIQSNYDLMNDFGNFGVVSQYGLGRYTELINLITTMKVIINTPKYGNFGFFGRNSGLDGAIKHCTFEKYNITTLSAVGMLCQHYEVLTSLILNVTVQTCNISAGGSVGGLISHRQNGNTIIQNATVLNINITGTGNNNLKYIGAIFGNIVSEYFISYNFENINVLSNKIQGISVTAGVMGQIDCQTSMMVQYPIIPNITFSDILLFNNNITGSVFSSGIVAIFSTVCNQEILFFQNLRLISCNIQCLSGICGGLVSSFGHNETQSAILTVKNSIIQNIKVSGPSYVAGFAVVLQQCIQFTTLQIFNTTVTSIILSGQNCGLVTGFLNGTSTFEIQTSKTTGDNFVNSTQIQNCASITSGISQSGC
ncbi:Conserved_hypothetical protein [Hexamita inflata]|uniref:Uncharacterized protein n=1 Tax=Hexamita inflata TaxID=28002 RepID=A0AA86RHP0_9EUKA|nr:Conserved hypothetical protein [Hexamita inflata]